MVANLQQELTGSGELEDLGVLVSVAADPHVVFRIDEDAVFVVGPLPGLSGDRTAPGLHHVAGLIEFDDGGGGHAAIRFAIGAVLVVIGQRARTMDDPDMIAGVDGDAGNFTQHPVIGKRLGPERIRLVFGQSTLGEGGGREQHCREYSSRRFCLHGLAGGRLARVSARASASLFSATVLLAAGASGLTKTSKTIATVEPVFRKP